MDPRYNHDPQSQQQKHFEHLFIQKWLQQNKSESNTELNIFNIIKYKNGNFFYGQVRQLPQSQEQVDPALKKQKRKKPKCEKHGIGQFIKNCLGSPDGPPSQNSENELYEYIGEFKNDMRHGTIGKCFFHNGDFYAGPWKND